MIDRNPSAYVVYAQDPVLRALEKITANKERIVFCVDAYGHLDGSLSDGDFRRWVTRQSPIDLDRPAIEAANTDPVKALVTAPAGDIAGLFTSAVDHVPLVDDQGRLVAVAIDHAEGFRIGQLRIDSDSPAVVISEIGINHNGSVSFAKELVDLSVSAGADVVKFQLRDMGALYRGDGAAGEDLGPQYTLDLLRRFNLEPDQLFEVFDHARGQGIEIMCTPWDPPSVDRLAEYGIAAFKVASADLTNHALLRHMAAYALPMVVSTGMATESEIQASVDLLRGTGVPYALLHCQSTYPAPFKDINLAYLKRLAQLGQCPVGYSGHERGFHVPIAAVAMGAKIVEKHFTTDRSLEGNDHKVSLLPAELAQMVKQIREVEEALGTSAPRQISTGEMMNRVNLAKSLVASRRIEVGTRLTPEDIDIKSPGRGLQPNSYDALVGRVARRPLDPGDFFYATDLSDHVAKGRPFSFRRPWGLPVRYHDIASMTADVIPDFLEFHFSYQDLDIDPTTVFDRALPMGFTTHSPDLFSGDFILNLASEDDAHWERSIAELQRVVDLTRQMKQWFAQADDKPVIIASLGGFTKDAFVRPDELPDMYARVAAGLDRVDDEGVRLCAQTLPPYPWYMGGQLYCNLFVGAEDTAAWAEQYGRRICLDVSHSKLAANHRSQPFSTTVSLLAPYAEHLHLVDAVGVDGEGVQVGEGDIDWPELAMLLDRYAPQASFIPEIWQGHVNNGEGFWIALERLEQWF